MGRVRIGGSGMSKLAIELRELASRKGHQFVRISKRQANAIADLLTVLEVANAEHDGCLICGLCYGDKKAVQHADYCVLAALEGVG